jgi:hypothetical protein
MESRHVTVEERPALAEMSDEISIGVRKTTRTRL